MSAPGPKTKIEIKMSCEEQKILIKQSNGLRIEHSIVVRSLIILYLYIGMSISDVSRKMDMSRLTVRKWATRYAEYHCQQLKLRIIDEGMHKM